MISCLIKCHFWIATTMMATNRNILKKTDTKKTRLYKYKFFEFLIRLEIINRIKQKSVKKPTTPNKKFNERGSDGLNNPSTIDDNNADKNRNKVN